MTAANHFTMKTDELIKINVPLKCGLCWSLTFGPGPATYDVQLYYVGQLV